MPNQELSPIHVDAFGEGRPALFVHGEFSTGRLAWSRQRATLPGRQQAVIDRRGYGKSPVADSYTIAQDVVDLFAVADALGWETFDLVGHSFGGVVSLVAASMHPERLTSLLVIEPPCLGLLPEDPEVARLRTATNAVREAGRSLPNEEIAAGFFTAISGADSLDALRASRGWQVLVEGAQRFPLTESPASITTVTLRQIPEGLPVTVMMGTESHPGLQRTAEYIAEVIPQATLIVVPEAGHAVQFNGAAFRKALDVLAPIPSPGSRDM